MDGQSRKDEFIKLLNKSDKPLSGDAIAKLLGVSRQVIVQDIALLRANGVQIFSTNRGYLLDEGSSDEFCRVYKVIHSDEETEDEMNLFVDMGATILDVFVYHRVYGVMRGELNVRSRLDVKRYMDNIRGGKSSLLKNVTGGYHYHTVMASSNEVLDMIQAELEKKGFLAKLSEYEPVKF